MDFFSFFQGGWTALVWACYKGHMDTATVLIDKQADVNVHGQYHVTPLMLASGRGHTAIVRLLLDHGARVNVGDKVLPTCDRFKGN